MVPTKALAVCIALLCIAGLASARPFEAPLLPRSAARQLQQNAPFAPTLYDCVVLKKMGTLRKLLDFTGLDKLLKDPRQKLTLLAADDAAFARLFADCTARGVQAVNKPPACSLAEMMRPGFKAKAEKLIRYHLLAGAVPAKVDPKSWNPSTTFAQLPTLLAGKKMKLRYTASTKTFEAHGTGRDAFVRKGATNMNLACGAGLMHVVDNLATLKPGTL